MTASWYFSWQLSMYGCIASGYLVLLPQLPSLSVSQKTWIESSLKESQAILNETVHWFDGGFFNYCVAI